MAKCLDVVLTALRVLQWASASMILMTGPGSLDHFSSDVRHGSFFSKEPRLVGILLLVYSTLVIGMAHALKRLNISFWRTFVILSIPLDSFIVASLATRVVGLSLAGHCHQPIAPYHRHAGAFGGMVQQGEESFRIPSFHAERMSIDSTSGSNVISSVLGKNNQSCADLRGIQCLYSACMILFAASVVLTAIQACRQRRPSHETQSEGFVEMERSAQSMGSSAWGLKTISVSTTITMTTTRIDPDRGIEASQKKRFVTSCYVIPEETEPALDPPPYDSAP